MLVLGRVLILNYVKNMSDLLFEDTLHSHFGFRAWTSVNIHQCEG